MVTIKDLIEFLSQLDPNLPVHLDKDGWNHNCKTAADAIEDSGIFYPHKTALIINN